MENMKRIFGKNKLYDHPDKINNFFNANNTIITAEIDLTNKCNNKCPGCTGFKTPHNAQLSYSQATSIIGQLGKKDVKGLVFTGGGEPLLHPQLSKILYYAKFQGMDVSLNTNGLGLFKHHHNSILQTCTWIRFSLDAGDPEIYEKIHGMERQDFYKVLENIASLVKTRQEYIDNEMFFNKEISIGTAFLTKEDTVRDMYNFAKVSKELKVDYAQFRPFHLDKTDVSQQIEKCMELSDDNFEVIASVQKYNHFKDDTNRPYTRCDGANFRTVITADNKVYACCHTRNQKGFCLGDLNKESFAEIWRKRHKVLDKIDVSKCVPFCTLDEANRELFNMKQERTHKNFL